ncbi:MAG: c-type cytochrome [Deltaproteobacteria bacterium]
MAKRVVPVKPGAPSGTPKLHFTGLVAALAVLSALMVGALAIAPARSYYTGWRKLQERYNALAARLQRPPVAVGIKQIWVPDLQVVDRCPTCHLSVEAAGPLAGDRLFAPHPSVPHDPRRIGCTPCHGGEGRATSLREAHGELRFRSEPVLERAHVEAGCGSCHSHIPTPSRAASEQGHRIFDEVRCGDCHSAGVRDLRTVGLHGIPADWHGSHVGRTVGGISFGPLADEEIAPVTAYLSTMVGAPRLMAGKMLAAEYGCRGCHRIEGVGGDLGPDLTGEGRRSLDGLVFTGVRGPHTLSSYLLEHFLDPQRVVSTSAMPALGMSEENASLLTTYVLSLRALPVPLEHAPPDRIRGLGLGQRDFPADGESLFNVFCVACHGTRGQGSKVPTLGSRVPPIGSPEFLALVEDRFLRETITRGRPGRLMPSWGASASGLRPAEIDAVVRYLRTFALVAPTFDAVMAETVDAPLGERLFAENCVGCHGEHAEGTVLAPPLGARDNLTTRADSPVYGTLASGVNDTAMRSFRGFDARSLRALVALVRSLPPSAMVRTGWARRPGDASRGEPLFAANCSPCHGRHGEGDRGPALHNPGFLAAATDDYITASIVRGLPGTEMPRFGTGDAIRTRLGPAQVADIVAFVRSWAPPARTPTRVTPVAR